MWHVYICDRNEPLYTGITTDLVHRMQQHKAVLLYSEACPDKSAVAKRGKEIEGWRRERKLALIEQVSLSSFGKLRTSSRSEGSPSGGVE
jgi:predicted GIY-YIG superfamily endonuclease